MLTAWRRVFTPFQVAQLTVQTYPGNADILAMIKCAHRTTFQSGGDFNACWAETLCVAVRTDTGPFELSWLCVVLLA